MSVTPPDAARVNRTIFHNHPVHWHYIARIEGRNYSEHDIIWHGSKTHVEGSGYSKRGLISWYDQQAGCNIIVNFFLFNHSVH